MRRLPHQVIASGSHGYDEDEESVHGTRLHNKLNGSGLFWGEGVKVQENPVVFSGLMIEFDHTDCRFLLVTLHLKCS